MDCSQVLPGAVNPGPCSIATGYYCDSPFIVYASGNDVVIVDGHLTHIQTVQGDTAIRALHCSEGTGKIAVAWDTDVVIFNPEPHEDPSEASSADLSTPLTNMFLGEWRVCHTLQLKHPMDSLCWNREGTQLLIGGKDISLWMLEQPPQMLAAEVLPEREMGGETGEGLMGGGSGQLGTWTEAWRCEVAIPVVHLKFSPDSLLFATAGENDRLVKLWYQPASSPSFPAGGTSIGSSKMFSFTYIAHPRAVTGFVWRRTSPGMPKGCVANVLLTYCKDNICRLWSHSLSGEHRKHFRFYIVASIDPVADIPFRTTLPLNNLPFIVHWLNNKETIFTSKASKYQKGTFTPISHHSSIQSFPGLNDEVLQSWVCIDDTGDGRQITTSLQPGEITSPESGGSRVQELQPISDFYLSPTSKGGGVGGGASVTGSPLRPGSAAMHEGRISVMQKRAYAHLMAEWNTSPDLLLCIHPSVGSLMVWTVEGLDAPAHASRLVHISFSSCLPHVFPPHLAQTLRQELLQFLIREQDVIHPRTSDETTDSFSLPVPQIRLSSAGSMATMSHLQGSEDVPKVRPESTLILVSSHSNGSLNTWSVELTEQSNSSTSIAGLIHCAGTGGHHSVVHAICRHPWLPILITVSSSSKAISAASESSSQSKSDKEREEMGTEGKAAMEDRKAGGDVGGAMNVVSELIIWNSDLPGPLKHESRLNELSRMLSRDPNAFKYVTWVPPISVGGLKEDAFARCPSSGLFVANLGNKLCLFQTSLYSITKPQPSSFMNDTSTNGASKKVSTEGAAPDPSEGTDGSHAGVTITSQLGKEGISLVSVIESDLSKFDQIMSLHTFRMCSLVTSFEVKKSLDTKFCKDVVVVLIENQLPPGAPPPDLNQASSPGPRSTTTLLHMWQITVCAEIKNGGSSPIKTNWDSVLKQEPAGCSIYMQQVVYSASVKKVYSSPLPLPLGCHVVQSSPACDIASSLQLQLPTLSAPFLFSTACSDGTIRCWQFSLKYHELPSSDAAAQKDEPAATLNSSFGNEEDAGCGCECHDSAEKFEFELFEVFGASSLHQRRRFDPSTLSMNCFDCREEDTIKSLPTQSFIPSAITNAYPGRFAMAHLLTKPMTSPAVPKESPRHYSYGSGLSHGVSVGGFMKEANPFNRYAVVSIWECESSGGLKWACETTLLLSGPAEFTGSKSGGQSMPVHMEWLPMENGAYLLACCFASTIFVFGMALPTNEDEFTSTKSQNRFTVNQKVATLRKSKSRASWVCLLQLPFSKLSVSQTISHFAYTGSNSLLLSCGRQMHLFSCWVRASHLSTLFASSKGLILENSTEMLREVTPASTSEGGQLHEPDSCINLLDYAHVCNTPLPQYHPKILMELMNSSHLHAVNTILVNLVKYLLLYVEKKKAKGNYFDEGGFEAYYGEDTSHSEPGKRKRLLSVTEDGRLRRSQHLESKVRVESIPRIPLSKLKILKGKADSALDANEDGVLNKEDEDDAFFTTSAMGLDEFNYRFDEEESTPELAFSDLDPETDKFTPEMAEKLSTTLEEMQLSDLTDVEQVRLLAIAETVANTKLGFREGENPEASQSRSHASSGETVSTAMSFGVGYAAVSLSYGVKGGEAMDDCGLRYLLALENYISLSKSLPSTVSAGHLMPSDIIWAFHSDAQVELLAALPCVQRDELNWKDLKDAGVGWWIRSSDLLRRLIEKLAKTQFMQNQEPLDAGLFYLAMRKQTLMKGLFKTVSNSKMMTFFSNDFTTERWKKAALKNAFALLGMQRFEHAAAFFLLADKLWDAVEVCVSRLEDLQLALVITRLYEGDNGEVYQRLLKEYVLGVSAGTNRSRLETSPDPFLRSMAHWLLQDYPGALETFLLRPETAKKQNNHVLAADEDHGHVLNPTIFNFYYFLRSHPVLIRRDYSAQRISFHPDATEEGSTTTPHVSGVGEEPLTPPERNLLFGTAYYHLCHGCPLLALNVLSKLPKDCDLGLDRAAATDKKSSAGKGKTTDNSDVNTRLTVITENMIQSGTLGDEFSFGSRDGGGGGADDFDWSQPVSSQLKTAAEDDFDWGAPVSSQFGGGSSNRFNGEDDEFDWSKPLSTGQLQLNDGELSPPHFSSSSEESSENQTDAGLLQLENTASKFKVKTLSTRGIFILSLGEQLRYNACLSILTEEVNTVFIPACCNYLWLKKGPRSLPLLPFKKPGMEKQSLASQFEDDAFEKTVLQLRGDLVQWLKEETQAVKEICGFDRSGDEEEGASERESDTNPALEASDDNVFKEDTDRYTAPAGYDLLTTLMNYTALHAATSPSLLTVKLELMHLMNSLLPWSTGFQAGLAVHEPEGISLSQSMPDLDGGGTSYAVDPAQLPILTSSSLPVRHLTNLALHLRLMSGSITDVLAQHNHPPISSKPLPNVDRVFELCCAISNSVMACLSPIRFSEFLEGGSAATRSQHPLGSASTASLGGSPFSPGVTPTPSGVWSTEVHQFSRTDSGGKLSVPKGSATPRISRRKDTGEVDPPLGQPNSKPSKWPGIEKWPNTLTSDEGKDPTPLSLVLVECLVSVYLGLFSVAWSRHSIEDILLLLRNFPSGDMWNSTFGGGLIMKKTEDDKSRRSRSIMQRVEAMTKRFMLIRKTSHDTEGEATTPGLFVAPSKSLLYHYLSVPTEEDDPKNNRYSRVAVEDAKEFCVVDDDGEDTEKEDGDEWEDEEDGEGYYMQGEGPMFRIGAVRSESVDHEHDPNNPNCFAWCLMNLCIAKMLQSAIRKVLNAASLEVLELVTASPLLYSSLKLMEHWESIFMRRLDALGPAPDDLFGDEEETESPMFKVGPAIMKHKSILEQDHSPFSRLKTKSARQAKTLWMYLARSEEVRETFIHYLFSNKPPLPSASTTSIPTLGSLDEEGIERNASTPSFHSTTSHERVLIVHREVDSIVSSFCVNSCSRANATQLAIALPRGVLEIEVPDTSFLDSNLPYGDSQPSSGTASPKRSLSLARMFTPEEEFVMIPQTSSAPGQGSLLKRPQSVIFPLNLGASRPPPAVNLHIQTGSNSSMMLRRPSFSVKRMAQHPSLSYYLTGSLDGSVVMWEFGTPHHVSVQRPPGMGASVTKIRFTPEGNKYGVTDSSGKLSLWQGIHTYTQSPYQMLTSGMKSLSDFLFLGSSSLIAACGDGLDNRNLILWDTLMPTNRGIVRDFVCHEGGATSLGYSRSRQRLFCGGRKGEVCVFDVRQFSLLQCLQLHSSAINCIAMNDVDGYFITGAGDGEIKVIDSSTLDEIATYSTMHTKSRLFRHSETGVTGMDILPGGKLYSCGVDGTVKCRTVTL